MSTDEATYDSRKFPVCCPHDGSKGESYTRRFRTDFIGGLWDTQDDYSSVAEHILEEDDGGAHGAAIPPGGGPTSENAKRRRAFASRSKKLFKLLRQHIVDPSFRASVDQPPVRGNGLAALALADQWYGASADNLRLQKQNTEWNKASLAETGVDEGSIRRLYTHLQTLNSERPAGEMHSDNALALRLLSCITFPATLESKAQDAMQSPSPIHPPGMVCSE